MRFNRFRDDRFVEHHDAAFRRLAMALRACLFGGFCWRACMYRAMLVALITTFRFV
jgi:hypothetical protein